MKAIHNNVNVLPTVSIVVLNQRYQRNESNSQRRSRTSTVNNVVLNQRYQRNESNSQRSARTSTVKNVVLNQRYQRNESNSQPSHKYKLCRGRCTESKISKK